jgi:hypothetical protein
LSKHDVLFGVAKLGENGGRSWMLDTGYGIQDTGYGILDTT